MKVCARAIGAKLYEGDALEAQTDDEPLFRVLVSFIPNAALGLQKVCLLKCEAIETGAAQPVFTLYEKAQADGQLAETLLVSLDRRQARHQIAFAVGRTARVQLTVNNGGGKRPVRPAR